MNTPHLPEVDLFLTPISTETPCGEDMSFSTEFDEIQEARREDDPSLDQGEWITSLKEADWKKSANLAQRLLLERTKDLRLSSWLAEALAKTGNIAGLARGYQIIDGLISQYWEQLHPLIEDGDLEQRIGNISWLITRSAQLTREFPLVSNKTLRYNLGDLDSARALQAAIDRNQDSAETTNNRTTLQQIREAQRSTPRNFYQQTLSDCAACRAALNQMTQGIDAHLGIDGPSFTPLHSALEAYTNVIERMARENGVLTPEKSENPKSAADEESSLGAESPQEGQTKSGPLRNREQALRQLRQVAEFFRHTEPHSPVAYLADKAANWGEMPLHIWLKTVLKDDGAFARFEDLLGLDNSGNES
jgi:type VI secretion system protein ImpA